VLPGCRRVQPQQRPAQLLRFGVLLEAPGAALVDVVTETYLAREARPRRDLKDGETNTTEDLIGSAPSPSSGSTTDSLAGSVYWRSGDR
jgi:hypothetical protein